MRVCALLLILSTASAVTASAQSLADVARKESDRRQAVTSGGKTYTDKDLKPVPAAPSEPDASTPADKPDDGKVAADGKTDAKPAKAADDKAEVKDQDYWAKRMATLVEQLERDETFLAALQNRIDSLTTDFVNRDDPAQKNQIQSDRQKALSELDRLKKAVEDDKRAIPDLEEEARREGVPAGWLR